MLDWRIYYAGGGTFDSSDGKPEDAPTSGVVCCVYPDPVVGRCVVQGSNWYHYLGTEWWGIDVFGVLDLCMHETAPRALKQGRSVSTEEFKAIMQKALDDPDFPKKSAKRRHERGLD